MRGDELLQDDWQGGGIKQTWSPVENKCWSQVSFRTCPQGYFPSVFLVLFSVLTDRNESQNWMTLLFLYHVFIYYKYD